MCICCSRRAFHARGLGLIDALLALLILSIGVLGVAHLQTRLLVDGRTASYRATAIVLIDDMHHRLLLNRDAALAGRYDSTWRGASNAAVAVTAACRNAACNADQLAQSDIASWRAMVQRSLPAADAAIFRSSSQPQQIGIAVAWAAHEDAATQGNSGASNPFSIDLALPPNTGCPAQSICQVTYVQP